MSKRKRSYTASDIDKLKRSNPFLEKAAEEKYERYRCEDPFPDVGEALLNSADLLMYLLTVGIVDPFDVNNLKGVTYQCTFSGEAHVFDRKSNEMKEIDLSNGEELILKPNSITYLKIAEKFHVPEYLVLRFNLSVSNAYKGLLLGTGPIVDPGFEGNLFIPLHNLTGNKYVIKKGASLIRVEFTKLSGHADWDNKKTTPYSFVKPITKQTPQNAKFSQFIMDALQDPEKRQFYTKGDAISVRSSIPDAIAKSVDKAKKAEKSAKAAKTWTIAGALGVLIALAAAVISVYSLIQDTTIRFDGMAQEIEACKQQIGTLTQQLEEAREQIDLHQTERSPDPEQEIEPEISGEAGVLSIPDEETGRVDQP